MALVIGEKATRELIDMAKALEVVEQMFHDRGVGKVRSLPRRRLRSSSKQLNVMAAWQERCDLIALRAYIGGANTISLSSLFTPPTRNNTWPLSLRACPRRVKGNLSSLMASPLDGFMTPRQLATRNKAMPRALERPGGWRARSDLRTKVRSS